MAILLFSVFLLLPGLTYAHRVLGHKNHAFFSNNSSPSAEYDAKYFTQNLDHFSFTPHSYLTFQQKYLINSKHWGGAYSKSPVFVYTGNEGYIEWFTQNTGFMFDIAPQFKALLVFIEHRYYGESMPFGSKDVAYSNTSTLGYLSSTQALADYAILITDLKKNLSAEDSPVVVFGGSYGGNYDVKYFTQNLDHFSFTPHSYLTFQQKYLINSKHWGGASSKSPIFVYTGNEGYIEWFTQNTGFMFDIAPQFKALLVFIEHRYYGESMPFGSKDVAYSNASTLGYLSSTQALADYAILITDLKKNLSAEDSPVVVFGGSYGGMLAAWFRLKYPHIAIGALASSAPILAFDDIVDSDGYYNIVSNDFRSESQNCFNVIKKSWKVLEEMTSISNGRKSLKESFRLCKDSDVDSVEGWLSEAYFEVAETDYPTPANFIQNLPAYPVKQMCKAIDNPSSGNNTLRQLYGAANIFYNYTGNLSCFDLTPTDPHGEGGWSFQASTEMIMPMTINPNKSMFPGSAPNYMETIQGLPYSQPSLSSDWIPTEFGGHNIKRALKRFGSNIIFFNGLRDPWSNGGVLEDINESIVAIIAKEGAHHVDLRFATKEDPKWLVHIRYKEIDIIKSWIIQYYKELHTI